MNIHTKRKFLRWPYRGVVFTLIIAFLLQWSVLPTPGHAQIEPFLPPAGILVETSPQFKPLLIKGIKINPADPFQFDFIMDTGNTDFEVQALKRESAKLIKYFLASLTVPDQELWVNLSPQKNSRVIPEQFGTTEMGQDLLAQDYLLKQISSSLIYPEKAIGKTYWDKIYSRAKELYGRTDVPINTFFRVWIVPEKAVVYSEGNQAFIVDSRLKVMVENDYQALEAAKRGEVSSRTIPEGETTDFADEVLKEVVIPVIEEEVNTGENFAALRQIYHSLILAVWFKKHLRESLLSKVYVGKNKIVGVDSDDEAAKERIYAQYLEAFKKGVFDYIRDDIDPETKQLVPRKYFSGGVTFLSKDILGAYLETGTREQVAQSFSLEGKQISVTAALDPTRKLDRLARLLNLLTKSSTTKITADASEIEVMESIILELANSGGVEQDDLGQFPKDSEGNLIIAVKKEAEATPFGRAVRRWVVGGPGESGVKAVNFRSSRLSQAGQDQWIILGFADDLRQDKVLKHEQVEIGFRKQGFTPEEAHNLTRNQLRDGSAEIPEEVVLARKARGKETFGSAIGDWTRWFTSSSTKSIEEQPTPAEIAESLLAAERERSAQQVGLEGFVSRVEAGKRSESKLKRLTLPLFISASLHTIILGVLLFTKPEAGQQKQETDKALEFVMVDLKKMDLPEANPVLSSEPGPGAPESAAAQAPDEPLIQGTPEALAELSEAIRNQPGYKEYKEGITQWQPEEVPLVKIDDPEAFRDALAKEEQRLSEILESTKHPIIATLNSVPPRMPELQSLAGDFARDSLDLPKISIPEGQTFGARRIGDNYEVSFADGVKQGAAADRASIFKEDPVHRGQVLTEEQLDDMLTPMFDLGNSDTGRRRPSRFQGYNFESKELADFFSAAAKSGVGLNQAEQDWLQWLMNEGILAKEGDNFVALKDVAVISYSQDLHPRSEEMVRRHELGHLLFKDPQYRQAIQAIWDGLSPEKKELFTKLIKYFGYHEEVSLTEFAEYFENPQLLLQRLETLYEDAVVYSSSGRVEEAKRRQAAEIYKQIFEYRWGDGENPRGQYLAENFRQTLKSLTPALQQSKKEALSRADLGEIVVNKEREFKGCIIPDKGPPPFMIQSIFIKQIAYAGNYSEISGALSQSDKFSSVQKKQGLKQLKRFIEKNGHSEKDAFQLSQQEKKWEVKFIRKFGERSLQDTLLAEIQKVGGQKQFDSRAILKAIRTGLQERSWGRQESFEYDQKVNAGGEEFIFKLSIEPSTSSVKSGDKPEIKREEWTVKLRLLKKERGDYWHGHVEGFERGESLPQAYDRAVEELEILSGRNALDLAPKGEFIELTFDNARMQIEHMLQTWQPDKSQFVEVYKKIKLNGQWVDLHFRQEKGSSFFRDDFKTKIAIELSEDESGFSEKIVNRLAVVQESDDRLMGARTALEALKLLIEKRGLKNGSSPVELNGPEENNVLEESSRSSQAMVGGADKVGGIDFNPTLLDLEEQGQVNDFQFTEDISYLENISFDGLTPRIIQMAPFQSPLVH